MVDKLIRRNRVLNYQFLKLKIKHLIISNSKLLALIVNMKLIIIIYVLTVKSFLLLSIIKYLTESQNTFL